MKLWIVVSVVIATVFNCKAFVPTRTITPFSSVGLHNNKNAKTITTQLDHQKRVTPLFMSDAAATPEPEKKSFFKKVSGLSSE